MKALLLICAILLLLAVANLPIGFYTLLRIVVTIGAVAVVVNSLPKGLGLVVIVFGLIGILFNPIIPVYLNDKSSWIPIDIICSITFLIKAFSSKNN